MQISCPMEELKMKSKSQPDQCMLIIKLYLRIEIDEVEDITPDVFDLLIFDNKAGKEVNPGDPVPVGDSMQITVSSNDPAITDFFLSDCTASNGKTAPDVPRSLELIRKGCIAEYGSLPIDVTSPNPGQYIAYNQFGFVDDLGA